MFNNVTLIGYLGSDAESRPTRNNSTLTVLSLATKRTWKNRETGAAKRKLPGISASLLDVPPNTPLASPKVHTFRSSVRSRPASTPPRTARRSPSLRSACIA